MKARRRTILKVLLLLAAGATLNVAVAWGCTVHFCIAGINPPGDFERKQAQIITTLLFQPGKLGIHQYGRPFLINRTSMPRRITEEQYLAFVPSQSAFAQTEPAKGRMWYSEQFAGWPCYALHGQRWLDDAGSSPTSRGIWKLSMEYKLVDTHLLPCIPLWPGFAINTLFYAGVLWVLFCGPFALRRMIRKRRGRCAQCAYPIGQSPVCTECGTPHTTGRVAR